MQQQNVLLSFVTITLAKISYNLHTLNLSMTPTMNPRYEAFDSNLYNIFVFATA